MAKPLNILIVEDSQDDADLVMAQLRRDGFDPKWTRVETESNFLAEIKNPPDIILSDYSMPQFSGLRAAQLAQESGLNIPFILISGTVGEDVAVEAMKHGATDYLLKDRIARLGPAVKRALEQKELRKQQQLAEAAARESQALYHSLVEQLPLGVFRKDREGRYLFVNSSFCRLKGMKAEEFLGKTAQEVAASEAARLDPMGRAIKYVDQGGDSHRLIMKAGKPVEMIEEYATADGQRQFLHAVKIPVIDSCGKTTGTQGILFDITERKVLEAEVALREQQLNAFFTGATAGLALFDSEMRYVQINTALADMNGLSAEEHIGRTIREVLPLFAPLIEPMFQKVLTTGESFHNVEFAGETPKQPGVQRFWVESIFPTAGRNGGPGGIGVLVVEITERKLLEKQFIQAQKMEVVGQLAGGVAHDFNNILGVIMGYCDFLTADLNPDSSLRAYVEEIRQATKRAAGLTQQLLVFSRKQTVQPVVLDLNDVMHDLEKMLLRLIDEHIELKFVPGHQIGRIKADPGYIGQVLMNLAVNARDAMPNGGKLSIATSNVTFDGNHTREHPGAIPGDFVMLSISDTGTGMTDEVKAHLFEAFFTTKPPGKGTGLGLTTCETIVQQSGGHIEVQSELGRGTTFKVYFPRVDQPLDFDTKFITTAPLPRGTETLLIVEDEPSLRHLSRRVLEGQGYEVLSAANGQEGLQVAREHKGSPIRLVVTDVVMPLMSGKVMAEWLHITYPDLKILFTSGYTDDAISQHGVLDTGVAFLAKPYTPAALARKVREILDDSR